MARQHSYRSISDARAKELLGKYMRIGQAIRKLYSLDSASYRAVVEDAILEAAVTYDASKGTVEETWVRTLIHWRLDKAARTERSEPTESLEPEAPDHFDPERAYLRDLVMRAIGQLSPRHQAVISCRMEGHTYEEIGQTLGISTACAHFDTQKALALLRSLLEKHG